MSVRELRFYLNGKEMHLAEWPGAGEAIVCLHGLTCNTHWFDLLGEKLSPAHRVIAYDLPGRGGSSTPLTGQGYPEHAADILAIIDRLELNDITLLGHSVGAMIACHFASQYPEKLKRLVLIDGGMDPDLSILVAIQPILDSLGQKYPSFEAYLEFMRSTPFYTVWSPFLESCFYHDVEHRPDGSVVNKMCSRYIFQEMMAMHKVQVNQLHQKIKTPVLVQRASQGLGLPGVFMLTKKKAEEIAGLVPGSRLVTIENANHFDIVTRDETAREIEEFLAAS